MPLRFLTFVVLSLVIVKSLFASSECAQEQLARCGHLVNKDKQMIAACFAENMDRFSPRCQEVARTIIKNVNESEYCRNDFQQYCSYDGPIPPSVPNMEKLFPCMIKHYDDFSLACKGYLDKNLKEMSE